MCISVARPAVAGRFNYGVGFLLPKKGERNCSIWLIPWHLVPPSLQYNLATTGISGLCFQLSWRNSFLPHNTCMLSEIVMVVLGSKSSSASTLAFLEQALFSFTQLLISTSAMKVELTGRWSDNCDPVCLYSNCLKPFPYHSIRSHLQRAEHHISKEKLHHTKIYLWNCREISTNNQCSLNLSRHTKSRFRVGGKANAMRVQALRFRLLSLKSRTRKHETLM